MEPDPAVLSIITCFFLSHKRQFFDVVCSEAPRICDFISAFEEPDVKCVQYYIKPARCHLDCAHEHGNFLRYVPSSDGFPADKSAMLEDTIKGTHVFKSGGSYKTSHIFKILYNDQQMHN